MAETYRRAKLTHYIERLNVRLSALREQLEQAEFQDLQHYIKGQISATDLILKEIEAEFDLHHEKGE